MKAVLLIVAVLAVSAAAQNSFCQRYTAALFQTSSAANQRAC